MVGPRRKSAPNKPAPGQKLGWSARIEKFCEAMAVEDSITDAAIKAGYSKAGAPGYGSRLLMREDVQARIKEIKQARKTEFALDIARLDKEVHRLATFDPRRMYYPDGKPIPIHLLDDDTAACVLSVEHRPDGTVKKYKVTDKNSAINTAMRRLGAFEVDNAQQANPLAEAMKFFISNGRTRFTPGAR